MKLIVFGATGSVGTHLVNQALQQGHSVTAFTRNHEKSASLAQSGPLIFTGDILNPESVVNAVKNHDCVLCTIGDGNKGRVRAAGTKNIIMAMQKTGIKRLICQTTLGLGDSKGNLNLIWKHIMFGFLLKKAFQDHQWQEKYLFDSDLDFTIVRPGALTDGEISGNYKFAFDGNYRKLKLKISRADVAGFMLQQLHTNEYLKKAVSISN
jgi:putative NADH-flavin reductase